MPNKNTREYRGMTMDIERDEEKKIVSGYATTFDAPYTLFETDDYTVREVVDRNAFESTDMSDVIMQYDHQGRVLARLSNNTLEIQPDDQGLFIKADLSGTELGRELYEEIRGGYTNKMSFGFTIDNVEETRTDLDDGRIDILMRITRVAKLYDVSAVSIPANDGTTIGVETRSQIDGVIEKIQAERLEELELRRRKMMLKLKLEAQR